MVALEGFVQVALQAKGAVAMAFPVVEVAGDDHRGVGRQGVQQFTQQLQLLLPVAFQQRQVHADRMHLALPRHLQHTVQQAAAFGAGDRHVQVAVLDDRVFGQQRIAVVAVRVDRVAAIGKVAPHAVGEEFVLRGLWPAGVARGVAVVAAEHFLKEDNVGLCAAHGLAQLRQDKAPVEGGEALVGIHRQYPQAFHGRGLADAGETITAGFEAHDSS
ncbi:hypothetical protein D3C75_715280 [compost metagenome]